MRCRSSVWFAVARCHRRFFGRLIQLPSAASANFSPMPRPCNSRAIPAPSGALRKSVVMVLVRASNPSTPRHVPHVFWQRHQRTVLRPAGHSSADSRPHHPLTNLGRPISATDEKQIEVVKRAAISELHTRRNDAGPLQDRAARRHHCLDSTSTRRSSVTFVLPNLGNPTPLH